MTTAIAIQDAERAFLGSCLLDNSVMDESAIHLPPSAFTDPANAAVWGALVRCRMEGAGQVDLIVLANAMRTDGTLEIAGGVAYIGCLINCVPTATMWKQYLDIILSDYDRRRLLDLCRSNAHELEQSTVDVKQTLANFETKLSKIYRRHAEADVDFDKLADGRLEFYEKMASGGRADDGGLSWGLEFIDKDGSRHHFDDRFGLIEPESMLLVAARTSHCKSVVAFRIAENHLDRGHSIAIATLDMPAKKTMDRLLCSRAGVSITRAVRGKCDAAEIARIRSSRAYYAARKGRIHLLGGNKTVSEIKAWARLIHRRDGLQTLVVDYFTRIAIAANAPDNLVAAYSQNALELKSLAKELGIVVVLLCQLNRVGQGAEGMPQLHHLKETGALEQEATTVMMLNRLPPQDPDGMDKYSGWLEWSILKNQNGATGGGKFWFHAPTVNIFTSDNSRMERLAREMSNEESR